MKKFSIFASPSFLLPVGCGLYVLFRATPAARGDLLIIVGFSTYGACELVGAAAALLTGHSRQLIGARALCGVGAMLFGAARFTPYQTLLSMMGALLFLSGFLLMRQLIDA